jgi:hypothetical protein
MNYSVTFDNGISVDIKKEDNGKYAVLLEGVVGVFGCSQFERNLSIDIVGQIMRRVQQAKSALDIFGNVSLISK